MNKYINVILISFFSVLTYKLKISFTLYLPIIIFLINHNYKNIFLILPISMISFYTMASGKILSLLVLYIFIIIYIIFFKKKKNVVIDCLYIFLINVFIFLMAKKEYNYREIIVFITLSMMSFLIYLYFLYNTSGVFSKQNNYRNYAFVEVIMALSAICGGATINIKEYNLGLFIAMFYVMYISQNGYSLLSIFLSIISMLILKMFFLINEAFILPFISAFYMLPNLYGAIILISFCLISMLVDFSYINKETSEIIIGVVFLFEIFKNSIVNTKKTKAEIVLDVYNQAIENVNNEIIGFASFLDLYAREFSTSNIYNQKISEGINSLTRSYCENCYLKNECYKKNKAKRYAYFKNMLLYSKRSDYENNCNSFGDFFKKCPYIVEMRKSAIILNNKLKFSKESAKNNTLVAQINGVSNILRQYSVDNALKNEFEYDVFVKIKKAICDYGYSLCYFNPKKILINDFLIEIGIRGVGFIDMKEIIEKIADNYIENKTTVIYKAIEKGKTYINLIPRINFEIDYGISKLAQEGEGACGDNYLVKELKNSKFIAAISDGMGKGYIASQESGVTLRLVDEITKIDLLTTTSLQILNTFYFIQDYLEKYSTLDFLEIDKNKGEVLFYKMGATTSYIFHKNGNFEKIENENLPFGIEEIIDTKNYKLLDGDIIIMSSDGVFENMKNEEELANYIKGIRHLPPQNITCEILKYAKEHKKVTDDDMCVITLKVSSVS